MLRFKRYATVANWPQANWATQLNVLLGGKALDVFSRLSQEDALDYERLKAVLLQRYNYTEQGYRQRFKEAKPEGSENPDQFIVRLRNYFTQWLKLSDVESSCGRVDNEETISKLVLKGTVGASDGEKPQILRELVAIAE